jgi:hypothetical protein
MTLTKKNFFEVHTYTGTFTQIKRGLHVDPNIAPLARKVSWHTHPLFRNGTNPPYCHQGTGVETILISGSSIAYSYLAYSDLYLSRRGMKLANLAAWFQ